MQPRSPTTNTPLPCSPLPFAVWPPGMHMGRIACTGQYRTIDRRQDRGPATAGLIGTSHPTNEPASLQGNQSRKPGERAGGDRGDRVVVELSVSSRPKEARHYIFSNRYRSTRAGSTKRVSVSANMHPRAPTTREALPLLPYRTGQPRPPTADRRPPPALGTSHGGGGGTTIHQKSQHPYRCTSAVSPVNAPSGIEVIALVSSNL